MNKFGQDAFFNMVFMSNLNYFDIIKLAMPGTLVGSYSATRVRPSVIQLFV